MKKVFIGVNLIFSVLVFYCKIWDRIFLIWSERTTPFMGNFEERATSKGYPFILEVIG